MSVIVPPSDGHVQRNGDVRTPGEDAWNARRQPCDVQSIAALLSSTNSTSSGASSRINSFGSDAFFQSGWKQQNPKSHGLGYHAVEPGWNLQAGKPFDAPATAQDWSPGTSTRTLRTIPVERHSVTIRAIASTTDRLLPQIVLRQLDRVYFDRIGNLDAVLGIRQQARLLNDPGKLPLPVGIERTAPNSHRLPSAPFQHPLPCHVRFVAIRAVLWRRIGQRPIEQRREGFS
jgi:hypothetical protein